jgi:nicotinamidase-related amidase
MVTLEVPEYQVAEEIEIEPSETALVVVDMQVDFVEAGGALPVRAARETVPKIRALVAGFRSRAMPVIFTLDSHRQGDPEFAVWGRHVLEGSPGEAIISELRPEPGDIVVKKTRYDAFYGTDLDRRLREMGVKALVIVGTVANICVHYTTASAAIRWYRVICPVDCVSALTEFDRHIHLRQTAYLFQGVLTTSGASLNGLGVGG